MSTRLLYHLARCFVTACAAAAVTDAFAGCQQREDRVPEAEARAVRVVRVQEVTTVPWSLVGTVRARYETPLAFRIGGQILRRAVQAGELVEAGQLLFELDPRDVEQVERAAFAQLRAAEVEADLAERERARAAALLEQRVASQQAYDLAEAAARSARERLAAARAQHQQAVQQRQYTRLVAPHAGTVVEVTGEPGQVVAPGTPVAMLAQAGPREIEVFVPENRVRSLPKRAEVVFSDSSTLPAELRELAGAADPYSRTWRARFRLLDTHREFELGGTARVRFTEQASVQTRVPLSAVYEDASGPVVWKVDGETVRAVPIRTLRSDGESVWVEGELVPGDLVVSAGTHLVRAGERVRPLR